MKKWRYWLGQLTFLIVALVLVVMWMFYYHNDWVTGHAPKWGWLQSSVKFFAKHEEPVVEPDEDPDNSKNEIPVHVAKVTVATVHRYIEGFGMVVPRPPRMGANPGEAAGAGSANIAPSVAGVVAKINCQIGQKVKAGDVLVQLDDRLAQSAEDQAEAGVAAEEAALALLKATPRPDQLQIAQLGVDKAQGALDFAKKNDDRQKQLAADQGTSGKNVEQAQLDLKSAENDLTVAQKQLAILKASPMPEEVRAEEAKVSQAKSALAAAKLQRQLLAITSPLDATVVAIPVNPGESVDTTRTLVQLVAMDRLMVDVDVPADQLPAHAEGLVTQMMLGTGPMDESKAVAGKVAFVSPEVEPKNGAVMVGIDLPAESEATGGAFRPGLTVRVRIVAEEHKDVLVVPREAVVQDENFDSVISIVEGEQATHQTIKPGLEENGMIEIAGSDKVKEGTQVVTQGAFGLRETQKTHVKVVE